MVVDNFEELVKEGEKSLKKKEKVEKPKPAKKASSKEDNNLFALIIAAIVILGIIGLVFGYTKDKITEIKTSGTDVTKVLEQDIKALQTEVTFLKERSAVLEKENQSNQNVVIDLFDKSRTIPRRVDAADWKTTDPAGVSFAASFPAAWEQVKPVIEAKEGEKKEEVVYLQPTGNADFINAASIRTDYSDFADLTLKEKNKIFSELDAIDTYNFDSGKMIYFINFDKDNKEVPTILILTDKNIYRATFNIFDKKLADYFEFRKIFEEIVATFTLNSAKAEEPKK